MLRSFFFFTALGLVCCLTACSDVHRPYPVSGKVHFRQRPAHGALITLVPLSNSDPKAPRPTGTVEKDGKYRLTTRLAFDGAPIGTYAVTIVYPSPEKKVEEQNAGPDLLQGKFSDPRTTTLRAEIKAESNELPTFDLK